MISVTGARKIEKFLGCLPGTFDKYTGISSPYDHIDTEDDPFLIAREAVILLQRLRNFEQQSEGIKLVAKTAAATAATAIGVRVLNIVSGQEHPLSHLFAGATYAVIGYSYWGLGEAYRQDKYLKDEITEAAVSITRRLPASAFPEGNKPAFRHGARLG